MNVENKGFRRHRGTRKVHEIVAARGTHFAGKNAWNTEIIIVPD